VRGDDPIDLHLHTTYSDGRWSPSDLFDHLANRNFRVVAVADHDSVAHIEEMRRLGAERALHVVAAVEVTTSWRGLPAHLLCYATQFTGEGLARLVERTERDQRANTLAVFAELQRRGHTFLRRHDVLPESDGQPVRPIDNARLLHAHSDTADLDRALAMIVDAGYRQITAPLAAAVAAAHASGALTLLAHPGRGGGEIHRFDPDVVEALLAEVPLDGIEVYYSTHTSDQITAYADLVRRHDLMASAGSDSHGPDQRLPVAYPARLAAALLARCGLSLE
jgi:predicted metal-dependent phosphoesterase TrpH